MKKILVVDDEKPISDIIKFNLTKEGYDVHTAYDGEEALKQVEEVSPDLIILDLMLPKMDGLEALQLIKKSDDHVKAIMITAAGQKEKMIQAIKYGAAEFISKPYEPDEVKEVVDKVLNDQQ